MKREYWARAPRDHIAAEIQAKFELYQNWLDASGYSEMIQTLYNAFYVFDKGGFGVKLSKDKRSAKIKVNHFKNLIERLHTMTTQAKLAYVPRARNSDAESQVQADLARGLIEYYNDEKNLGASLSEAVLTALVMLEAFILADWDEQAGEEEAVGGMGVKQGDQAYSVYDAYDVARHTQARKSQWYIVRQFVNRFDEAARIRERAMIDPSLGDPDELYDKVLSSGSSYSESPYDRIETPFDGAIQDEEDVVEKLILYHGRTSSLPTGRHTEIIGDVVLIDQAMEYKTLPVVRLSCSQILKTIGGDSPATSLLSVQQAIDALYSAVVTNNLNHAKQNVWSKTRLQVHPISEGQNNIVSPEKPEALQLTASAKETYSLIDTLQTQEQLLSGVNSTVRGSPEKAVDTAAGQALMLAQAVQFVDSLQQAYARAASEVATITIHNIQKFASEEMVAYIGGITRASYARTFKSDDINRVDRISVDIGNPLTQNISGRYTILSDLIKMGAVKDINKVNEFLRTGQIDSITEDQFQDGILIRQENEKLRKGENPPVLMTDLHPNHILKHKEVANDPAVRADPVLFEAVRAHLQLHIDLQRTMDPDLAAILGLPPLPSQQMAMMPPPPGAGGPPGAPGEPPPEQLPGAVSAPGLPPGTPPETQASFDQYLQTAQGPVAPENADFPVT
jgi:hypothetical protein